MPCHARPQRSDYDRCEALTLVKLLRHGTASIRELGISVKATLRRQPGQPHTTSAPLGPTGMTEARAVATLLNRATAAIAATPADPLRVLLLAAAFVAGVLAQETVRTGEVGRDGVCFFCVFFLRRHFRNVAFAGFGR